MTNRTPPAVHQPVTCQHCEGASGHPPIPGEGVAVCTPCVYRLGRLASENTDLNRRIDQARIDRRLRALTGDEGAA